MTILEAIAVLSWAMLLWICVSGIYCWGQDNGYWGQGPGVE